MHLTKNKKLFWQIPVLVILGLAAVESWHPGTAPVFREVTVQWNVIRLNHDDPRAARILEEMGPKAKRAVPALIKALDFSRPEVLRGTAGWALGQFGPAAVPALSRAYDSSHHEVRDLAERALGNIGGPAAEPAIESLVRIRKEDRERDGNTKGRHSISGALVALGNIGGRGLEPFITDLLTLALARFGFALLGAIGKHLTP
jgi:HEAT repeat protein